MSALIANPNRTAQDYEAVASMLPEKEAASLRANFEMRTREQQGKDLGFAMQTMSAFDAGAPDVGLRLLREKAQAERNSGREDQAKAYETWASIAEQNPQAASATIGTLVSRLPGGKEAIDGYAKVREERRLSAKAPFDLRSAEALAKKAEADVDEAQIRLKRLDAIQEAELRKSTSEADAATIRAKFAERRERAELDLKSAQSAASRASTEKTNFEVQDLKRKADEGPTPVYNAQAGGFVVAPTKANPRGGFIPLNSAADAQQQQAALRALKSVNYDPVTGEDDVSKLIPKSTSGGTEALFAKALRGIGVGTSGMRAIAALETAAATITLELLSNRLGAGVSNTDREFVLSKLGDIANPNKTAEERLAGWISAKNRMLTSGMLPPPGSRNEPSSTADGLFNEADAILRGGR
jgi:hypothetical protein